MKKVACDYDLPIKELAGQNTKVAGQIIKVAEKIIKVAGQIIKVAGTTINEVYNKIHWFIVESSYDQKNGNISGVNIDLWSCRRPPL